MSLQTKWHSIAHWHFSLFFSSVITACTHRSFQNNAPRKARNVPLSDIYEGTVSTTYRLLPVQHWMPSASQSFNENRRWANFSRVLSREKLHVNPQNYNSVRFEKNVLQHIDYYHQTFQSYEQLSGPVPLFFVTRILKIPRRIVWSRFILVLHEIFSIQIYNNPSTVVYWASSVRQYNYFLHLMFSCLDAHQQKE